MGRRKKTSMQDIAEYVGVSKNTVSLALNNKPGVSDTRRKEIFAAARALKYSGFEDDKSSPTQLVVVAPTYVVQDTMFYPEIIWLVEKKARERGLITTITAVTPNMEDNLTPPSVLADYPAVGVFLLGVLSAEYVNMIVRKFHPVVYLDTFSVSTPVSSVTTDNILGAIEAVRYLIGCGHRHIGFVGPISKTTSCFERWMGYQYALNEAGIVVDSTNCCVAGRGYVTEEDELKTFVDGAPADTTAWFCANDRIAISLIHVLHSIGKNVPDDVSIIGFDDMEGALYVIPKLTTMRVPKEAIVQSAVDLLVLNQNPGIPVQRVALRADLIIRGSVADVTGRALRRNAVSVTP